jgi:hypothetical protein
MTHLKAIRHGDFYLFASTTWLNFTHTVIALETKQKEPRQLFGFYFSSSLFWFCVLFYRTLTEVHLLEHRLREKRKKPKSFDTAVFLFV